MSETTTDTGAAAARPRVAIAGGSGFIGRRLAAVLGGSGHDVIILSRKPPRPAIGPVGFFQWHPGPDGDVGELAELLGNCRAVVNLCGESVGGPRWTAGRKAELIASRVNPTRTLIAACRAAGRPPDVFVQASGVGYYGTGNRPVDEGSGSGDDFLAELARQWEAPLADLPDGIRAITVRLGVVLGRGGGALAQMLMPFRIFLGGPISKGTQWLSWIHLHDTTAILADLLDDPAAAGIYNLVAPNPVRNVEFAEAAGRALGRPTWMITPRFVLNALLGEQATLVCDGQQATSKRLKHAFAFPDIDSALADLV